MPTPKTEGRDAGKEQKAKKPLEYRRFEEVLKRVIKAPPMPKRS
jgi:hypothetical protein